MMQPNEEQSTNQLRYELIYVQKKITRLKRQLKYGTPFACLAKDLRRWIDRERELRAQII